MRDYIKVARKSDFNSRKFKCFRYLGKWIAVIKEGKEFYAIEAGCKHQNVNLFAKGWQGGPLTCPAHGWVYDLKTGICETEHWACLRRFPIKVEGDDIWVLPVAEERQKESEDSFLSPFTS